MWLSSFFNDKNPLSTTSRTTLKILTRVLINYFKEILLLASQKYVCAYIAKILLSFHKEVQSWEVNITIKFFAFEWVGVDLLTLTADTEDFPEFLISKETLKIPLGCTELKKSRNVYRENPSLWKRELNILQISMC